MLTNALKSTSALALCAAMMAPPAVGQSSQGEAGAELEICGIMGPFPCKLEDGTVIEDAAELAREKLTGDSEDAPAADAPPEDTPPAAEPAPDDSADEEPAAEDDKSLLDSVIEEAGEAVEDLMGTAPEEDQPADAEPQPDEAAPEDAPEAQEEPADEPVIEDAPEAEETPADEPVAEETPADEPVAEEEPAAEEEEPAEDQPAADEQPAADGATEDGRDGAATAPQPRPEAAQTTPEEMPEAAAAAAEAEAEGDPDAGMEGDADVTVEEVTEEEARSSSEEFDTAVGAENRTPEARSGMSDFERALLIGLGAVAVGTILYNGAKIVSNSGDRIVVRRPDGTLEVLKNDDEILRRPGSEVVTRTFDDGSVRTVVTQPDGTRIITIRAANGTALKRTRVLPDGSRYVLFDDTQPSEPVDRVVIDDRQPPARETLSANDEDALRAALIASMNAETGRRFSLRQIRQYAEVRDLAPMIEVDAITFDTGSAVIKPSQAEQLAGLGIAIREVIEEVPGAVFLVEGHTDAVGDASYNLALSDRRAESVALALTEYFDVPPENLITQGYGESELKIRTNEAERRNRRATVRNITPLLR
ncbi:OmpA family protein [Maritimibacter fusiformis]|uniref:OmpA family protein n=1 Tax=Maritimibacter fusiformis TaxID=2603819 RepID=A0A5D0RL42_9RHOB|nr:OmpA family protein [Maritimibacter fusiformis]TYB81656.1 OmpA family protein [Maritimibacter fusiformis]